MRTTPPHLHPAMSGIRRYVERMPEGATLTQVSQKVRAYARLGKKDKEALIGLIRAAEEAEKKAIGRAEVKKQLDPLKLEILQSYEMASRKFDDFVDAMADMGKAVQKLKQIVL